MCDHTNHLPLRICGLTLLSRHQILNRSISAPLERRANALQHDVVNLDAFLECRLAQGLIDRSGTRGA
jgi:hypothetical protein